MQAPRKIDYEEVTISDDSWAGKRERRTDHNYGLLDAFPFPQSTIPFLLYNFNFFSCTLHAF